MSARSAATAVGSAASAVVNARRRFRARRRTVRIRTARRLLVAGALLAGVAGGAWVTVNSALFDVRTVTVEGTSRLSTAQVLSAADVTGGSSLFRLDTSAIEQRVLRLRPAATVAVSRSWPHGVVIRVTERRPVAVVTGGGDPMLMDRQGVAFAPAGGKAGDLVPVHVDAPVPGAGEREARAAMQVLSALPPGVRAHVSAVRAPSPEAVSFSLTGGRTVVWGSPADSATKAGVLRSLLRRPAHVYDVSTPEVVVTR